VEASGDRFILMEELWRYNGECVSRSYPLKDADNEKEIGSASFAYAKRGLGDKLVKHLSGEARLL
jgi:hypothetical protein